MLWSFVELSLVLIGLAVTPILFYNFPSLPAYKNVPIPTPAISVIIPARNEEHNLPLLLEDLRRQTLAPLEIICVDDQSSDATAQAARSYGVTVLSLTTKPDGWTGKAWACQSGAAVARGELLLFLDADVRLHSDGLLRLAQAYRENGCTISVQPYHQTKKLYEQFSLPFNLIQLAANGTTLPASRSVGLFGPVICMAKKEYISIGGHASVHKSIVEDMALAACLKKAGLSYRVYVGDRALYFRMYANGLTSLLQGWTKNMAAGAAKTPFALSAMVFVWITSLTSVPIHLVRYALVHKLPWLTAYLAVYAVWVFVLLTLSRKAGRYLRWTILFYPVLVAVFLGVFAISLAKRIFGLQVVWKGRSLPAEDSSCS